MTRWLVLTIPLLALAGLHPAHATPAPLRAGIAAPVLRVDDDDRREEMRREEIRRHEEEERRRREHEHRDDDR